MEPYNRSYVTYPKLYQDIYDNGTLSNHIEGNISSGGSLNGFKNPRWYEQVRAHQSATTSCSGTSQICNPGFFELKDWMRENASGAVYRRLVRGTCVPRNTSYPSQPAIGNLDNIALTRFYNAATSQTNQVNGGVILGELRDTVRQLKHPFKSLVDLLQKRERKLVGKWNRRNQARSVRDRKITTRDFLDAAADTWLETNLGLKPFVSDIEDILQRYLFAQFDNLTDTLPIRGAAVSRTKSRTSSWTSIGSSKWERITVVETLAKARYKGQLRLTSLNSLYDSRHFSRLGLSLREFLPVLWEVTPWSFVVDYFADVGGLINSFNVPRSDICWFNRTLRTEITTTIYYSGKWIPDENPSYAQVRSEGYVSQPGFYVSKSFQRSGGTGPELPRPSIVLDLPSPTQFTTLLALALSKSRSLFSITS